MTTARLKLEWGKRAHINLVRWYDKVMSGLIPVKVVRPWESKTIEGEVIIEEIVIECPECGVRMKYWHYQNEVKVDEDDMECAGCETEFRVDEFDIYVKTYDEAN